MLYEASQTKHAARNRLMIQLSYLAGLRACELASLKLSNVYDSTLTPLPSIRLTSDQTKGSSAGSVPVSKALSQELEKFAASSVLTSANLDRALLESAKGGHMRAQAVVNLFAHLYELADIPGASSHSGRRHFITSLADKAISVRVIQALARHRSISTTQRYIDFNEHKLRQAVDLLND